MRPELLNRFNEIILFHPLSKQELRLIFDLIFMEYKQKLEVKNSIKVNISKEAKEYLIEEGEKQHFGARPLRRIIEEQIITPISDMIINNSIRDKIINVDLVNSGIICKVV
jgi:ATP-dependent Clp protease ATP-binding subunit ClpA